MLDLGSGKFDAGLAVGFGVAGADAAVPTRVGRKRRARRIFFDS
jgi:hypothetical protein